jgi:hypothetical protein
MKNVVAVVINISLLLFLSASSAVGQDTYSCWGCESIGSWTVCVSDDGDTGKRDWCTQYYNPNVCNFSTELCHTFIYDEFPADLSTSVAGTYLVDGRPVVLENGLRRDFCTGFVLQAEPAKEGPPTVIGL